MADHTSILSTSLSMGNPGNIMYGTTAKDISDNSFKMNRIDVDQHFLETFEIPLSQGRAFLPGEDGKACLINETAFKNYGWENLDGKKFDEFSVVGIVKDFHVSSMHKPVEAVSLVLNSNRPSTLNLRIRPQNVSTTMEFIRKAWQEISPQTPFEYQF